jgi:hypothetical protein
MGLLLVGLALILAGVVLRRLLVVLRGAASVPSQSVEPNEHAIDKVGLPIRRYS